MLLSLGGADGYREVVPFKDLSELSGRNRPAAVKRWLEKVGVQFYLDADGRPCTTAFALNEPLFRPKKKPRAKCECVERMWGVPEVIWMNGERVCFTCDGAAEEPATLKKPTNSRALV